MSAHYGRNLAGNNGVQTISVVNDYVPEDGADKGSFKHGSLPSYTGQSSPSGLKDCSYKRPLKKSTSNSSISSSISINSQDYVVLGPESPKVWGHSRENELGERMDAKTPIEYESDSGFRERLPSFKIQQTSLPARLQTHFTVYKFVPRHKDELAMNVGDAIHVQKAYDDLWYEGTNLKSGEHGVFPSRYVSDILSNTNSSLEFSETGVQFFLRFLGSVEVFEFKGNTVLCQAISKILNARKNSRFSEIPPCTLEVDQRGIRLVDHAQELNEKRQAKSLVGRLFNNEQKVSRAKYFFKLKDVTFCGCYPNSPRYFGFVTKHPTEHRFACHTFISEFSTEPVAKAIGQAFRRFYADYVERSSTC